MMWKNMSIMHQEEQKPQQPHMSHTEFCEAATSHNMGVYLLAHLPQAMLVWTAECSDSPLPSGLSRRSFLLYQLEIPPKSKQEVLCCF